MEEYTTARAFSRKICLPMLLARKCASRSSGKATILVAAAIYFSISHIVPALAGYEHAKAHFDNLDADSRFEIGLGLIATGDFKGMLESGFTRQLYDALTKFQIRERFTPDGELDGAEFDLLKSRSAKFYDSLGFRYYDHPDAASRLIVPRLAFDSETRTPRGLAFERDNKSLSLSFVAYPAGEKTFGQLYDSMVKTSAQRKVVYKEHNDHYFVSSGFYKGRHYYTWMRAIPNGSTGFTLSWTSPLNDLGSRISVVLANLFVSGDISDTTVDTPSEPALQAKQEVPQGTTGSGISADGQSVTNFDGATAPADTASVGGGAAPGHDGTTSVDGGTAAVAGEAASVADDAAGPSVYWRRPLSSRMIEIKGYVFVFAPSGSGKTGTIKGGSFFTQSHTGRYQVLQNDAAKFAIKVNIGDDEPNHTNALDAEVEIQGRSATLTGTLRREDVGQVTETVQGDGSENHPFLIKFAKGSLEWRRPSER